MKATKKRIEHLWIVGLLGAATLLAVPTNARAEQGKWWDPQTRVDARPQNAKSSQKAKAAKSKKATPSKAGKNRGSRESYGSRPHDQQRYVYRVPAWSGNTRYHYEAGPRFHRVWRGHPVYRDQVWVTSPAWGRRPGAWGWRYWAAPVFYYPTQVCIVRPVRFFVTAHAVIGGVTIGATYADPAEVFGCNFCDARFGTYGGYARHVSSCAHAPHDYRVVAHDWDDRVWSGDDRWERDDIHSRSW